MNSTLTPNAPASRILMTIPANEVREDDEFYIREGCWNVTRTKQKHASDMIAIEVQNIVADNVDDEDKTQVWTVNWSLPMTVGRAAAKGVAS